MTNLLLLLAAPAAQAGMIAQATVPPPPVVVALEPPPSTVINAVGSLGAPGGIIGASAPVPARPFLVDLNVTAQGRTLYAGSLRVAPGSQASYEQSLTQAPAAACPGLSGYQSQERSSLQVSLSIWADPVERTHVSVSWNRAVAGDDGCRAGATRSVQLSDAVMLEDGKTAVLEGDAGLRVSLRRH